MALGLLLFAALLAVPSVAVWPEPQSTRSLGGSPLPLCVKNLFFPNTSSIYLAAAFARYEKLIFSLSVSPTCRGNEPRISLEVVVTGSTGDKLNSQTDESYKLLLSAAKSQISAVSGNVSRAHTTKTQHRHTQDQTSVNRQARRSPCSFSSSVPSVFGAMHGLETLSQLVVRNPDGTMSLPQVEVSKGSCCVYIGPSNAHRLWMRRALHFEDSFTILRVIISRRESSNS
jgi:hypothetical protein